MKIMKNKFFKIAALMVMLCLVTTCAIGTTFAKYVTGQNTSDSARVAKWGVRVTIQGDDLLKTSYATDDTTNYSGAVSVESNNGNNVVAPGTSGSAEFSIVGTPEVAVQIDIDFAIRNDVVLPADSVDGQTDDYYPLVFTLKQIEDANGAVAQADQVLVTGTLADIKDFLDDYSGAQYAPNTNLKSVFVLSWEWAYESGNDAADTLLGDIMAGVETVDDSSVKVGYALAITVTQID